jgi:hypothetical protein
MPGYFVLVQPLSQLIYLLSLPVAQPRAQELVEVAFQKEVNAPTTASRSKEAPMDQHADGRCRAIPQVDGGFLGGQPG